MSSENIPHGGPQARDGEGLAALGIGATDLRAWQRFFREGRSFAVPVDRPRVRRLMRGNTLMLVIVLALIAASVGGGFALVGAGADRVSTFVLLGLFVLALLAVVWKVLSQRRQLRIIAGTVGDEYVAISPHGFRFGGAVEIPWSAVLGGVGYDRRDRETTFFQRLLLRLSRATGDASSDLVFGIRVVERHRAAATGIQAKAFTVTLGKGGLRIPLDTAVEPDSVHPLLAAACVAGSQAGVHMVLSNDARTVTATITRILSGRRPTAPPALPLGAQDD